MKKIMEGPFHFASALDLNFDLSCDCQAVSYLACVSMATGRLTL